MSATEIINEIKRLPAEEREQVITYVDSLKPRMLSGAELNELGRRFVDATDPAEVEALREQITRGFYGR